MSNNAAYLQRRTRARAEDLAWLAQTGETLEGAATRLETTVTAIEAWCRKNSRTDLFHALTANSNRLGSIRAGRSRW